MKTTIAFIALAVCLLLASPLLPGDYKVWSSLIGWTLCILAFLQAYMAEDPEIWGPDLAKLPLSYKARSLILQSLVALITLFGGLFSPGFPVNFIFIFMFMLFLFRLLSRVN